MPISLKNKLQKLLRADDDLTFKVKKNIVLLFLIRGFSIVIGFLLVPLTIHYVNPVQYGIWLTIASLVAWINTFDIGLSNGLRNKLSHAIALNESEKINQNISSTYGLLAIIALFIFALAFIGGSFFNWNHLLKIPDRIGYNIWPIIIIATGFFCMQFVLQPINSILIAAHQPFKASLFALAGQLITLLATFILTKYTSGNLYILVFVVSGSPVLALIIASCFLFSGSLKTFRPRLKFIDLKSAGSLLNLGAAFFFVQIGALILYETDNIVITRTLGPGSVTTFNVAYKYFSILILAFNIILTPYWSAFTDAFAKEDFRWIKGSIKKLRMIWLGISVLSFILYLFSSVFYRLWVGENIIVPNLLSLSIAFYVVVQNWTVIHSYFLNGTGKLRIQLIMVISTGVINIPLSILLIKQVGIQGTVIANILVMLFMNIFLTYQCHLLINKKAIGIWNR
ncbi:MAG: lipopolysaccharide biosynthesis protein [Mucilaginibacter sp.]